MSCLSRKWRRGSSVEAGCGAAPCSAAQGFDQIIRQRFNKGKESAEGLRFRWPVLALGDLDQSLESRFRLRIIVLGSELVGWTADVCGIGHGPRPSAIDIGTIMNTAMMTGKAGADSRRGMLSLEVYLAAGVCSGARGMVRRAVRRQSRCRQAAGNRAQ